MADIKNFEHFIFETHGYNKLTDIITEKIVSLINNNFGKLLLNKKIILNSELNIVDQLIFIKDRICINQPLTPSINKTKLKIDDNIIYDMELNINLILSTSEKSMKKIDSRNKVYQDISHEILYVVELYKSNQQFKKESESWKYGEKLQHLINKYNTDKNWQDISYFIYLSLPHEIRARKQQLNKEIDNLNMKGILNVQKYIKNTKIYKDLEFITKLDSENILNLLKNDINYKKILTDFSINYLETKNINYENNFIKYFNTIKEKNKKTLPKLLKVSYNFETISIDLDIDYKKYN